MKDHDKDKVTAGKGYLQRGPSPFKKIIIPLAALLVFMLVSALGYKLLRKDYTWIDSFYMTVITISTVGYKEIRPLSEIGRIWTMVVIAGGLIVGAVALSTIAAVIVEGKLRRIFGRRQLERKIESMQGHVIVCGYGHMGMLVVRQLAESGRRVVVIDVDQDRTTAAERQGLLYILGSAENEEVLKAAGIERAETLVASLPSDAENVFVILAARQINPNVRLIARARDLQARERLIRAGASRVICPQVIGASRIADVVLRPAVVDFVEVAHKGVELEMDQLVLRTGSKLAGKTLQELELPRRFGAHIVAVRRKDGEALYQPTGDLKLNAGDTIILVGKRGAAEAMAKTGVEEAT